MTPAGPREGTSPGAARRLRRLFLLALILFLLATAVPGTASASPRPRRDPQLQDAGPPPINGTGVDSTGQMHLCPDR